MSKDEPFHDATLERVAPHTDLARRLALILCVGIVLALVSTPVSDYTTWQHLAVGQAIWRLGEIPKVNVWTWPTFGQPYLLPSWLFRVVLWPFYRSFGVGGLMLWRWGTALLFLGLLVLATRRGAPRADRALAPALIVWGALFWHARWQCGPETLVAPLFAAELALLEAVRHREDAPPLARDPLWLLVPIMIAWINLHLSYYLGLVAILGFVLDGALRAARDPARRPHAARLAAIGIVAAAACFLNPFGGAALAQPFQLGFQEPSRLLQHGAGALEPVTWSRLVWNGLALYLALAVGLAVRRWRRVGFDAAQAALLAVLLAQMFVAPRFVVLFVVATLPTLVRDVAYALRHLQGWSQRPAWARAALGFAPVLALVAIEGARIAPSYGRIVDDHRLPVRACDFMAEHQITGRGYNEFWHGGYLLWRFWPDRGRLPFIDTHATGSAADHELQARTQTDSAAWRALEQQRQFDWVLLPTRQTRDQHLLDTIDADSTHWALVFADDAASLFVSRDGANAPLVSANEYRVLRLGATATVGLSQRVIQDSTLRAPLARELERAIAASRVNARAVSLRATVELAERRWPDARRDLEAALAQEPTLADGYDRLAYVLLRSGQPLQALQATRRARALGVADSVTRVLARDANAAISKAVDAQAEADAQH